MPRVSTSKIWSRVRVIGPGAWGSALASVAAARHFKVEMVGPEDWSRMTIPDAESASTLWIIATPFRDMLSVLTELKSRRALFVLNASKGIDKQSLKTFSQLAAKYLPKAQVATLSGPTFAEEVLKQKPTACVVASKSAPFAKNLAAALSTSTFRIYTNKDILGVEICGALKNVLAIACGLSDGLQLGMNARAALLTRGLREMATLVKYFGGEQSTVAGLAGVGDLWLTATGDLSRNRQLGLELAKGESPTEALRHIVGPAEGLYTVSQVEEIRKKARLDLPISHSIYRVCLQGLSSQEAIRDLMMRDLKAEDSRSSPRRQKVPSKKRSRA